jgi:phosphoribosylformimino-5-aminoimidazole carboxamide ribotide isomerase
MIVIPAIDLKGGRCVRMIEGRLGTEHVVSQDAVAQARAFEEAGAQRIHVVDLDGAFDGKPKNAELISQIVRAVGVPVEVGGGLRNAETVEAVLAMGAAYAIVGTMAVVDPDLLARICARYPGRIIAGVDAKRGKVATEGWVAESSLTTLEVASRAAQMGVAAVITTDIARDGTGRGADVTGTESLARALKVPVIASGGVAGLSDIQRLSETSIFGVVVGRAIYDGSLDLREALSITARTTFPAHGHDNDHDNDHDHEG